MMQEDLTLKAVNDSENHQSLLYAIGDQQLDVVVSKLKRKIQSRDYVRTDQKLLFVKLSARKLM